MIWCGPNSSQHAVARSSFRTFGSVPVRIHFAETPADCLTDITVICLDQPAVMSVSLHRRNHVEFMFDSILSCWQCGQLIDLLGVPHPGQKFAPANNLFPHLVQWAVPKLLGLESFSSFNLRTRSIASASLAGPSTLMHLSIS